VGLLSDRSTHAPAPAEIVREFSLRRSPSLVEHISGVLGSKDLAMPEED